MPYRCVNYTDGTYDGMIFSSYSEAEKRCAQLNRMTKANTTYTTDFWSIETIKEPENSSSTFGRETNANISIGGSDNSGAEFAGLVAVLFGIVGGLLSWLFSTQIGRKVLAVLAIFLGIVYAKNAWENRAYVDTIYYENGNIKAEQSYKFKKLNGVSKFYSENGKLEKEQNYKNNELEGPSTEYYANGKAKSEQNYTAGKLNGVSIFYLETGIKEKEQTYKDDVKNGPSKIYYPNGTIKSEAMISNNTLNGVSILYDENGNILRKENFVNGKSTNIIE